MWYTGTRVKLVTKLKVTYSYIYIVQYILHIIIIIHIHGIKQYYIYTVIHYSHLN